MLSPWNQWYHGTRCAEAAVHLVIQWGFTFSTVIRGGLHLFWEKLIHFCHGLLSSRLVLDRNTKQQKKSPQRVELFAGKSAKLYWAASVVTLAENNVCFQFTFQHLTPFLTKQRCIYHKTFQNASVYQDIIYFLFVFHNKRIVPFSRWGVL